MLPKTTLHLATRFHSFIPKWLTGVAESHGAHLRHREVHTRFFPGYSRSMRNLLEYLELILTAAGVLVVIAVFAVFRNVAPWKAAALSALAVGVLHGIIFFAVRSSQRRARRVAVVKIRRTFDDLVRNKLQVVLFATEIQDEDWRPAAQRAVLEIENSLNRIESESFRAH